MRKIETPSLSELLRYEWKTVKLQFIGLSDNSNHLVVICDSEVRPKLQQKVSDHVSFTICLLNNLLTKRALIFTNENRKL